MTSATLSALPAELVEIIVSFIDLSDICSLRLACRVLANNASSGRFRAFFRCKNIYLTTSCLENLARITNLNNYGCHLACFLHDCTLVGLLEGKQVEFVKKEDNTVFAPPPLPVTAEELEKVARQTQLLTEIFSSIREARGGSDKNSHVCLSSLSLRVLVRQEDGMLCGTDDMRDLPLPVWDMAQRTFQITMDALLAAKLGVRMRLGIFHPQEKCSLSSRFFSDFLREKMAQTTPESLASLKSVFSSLKHLAISFSGPHSISGQRKVWRDRKECDRTGGHIWRMLVDEQHAYFMEAFQIILDLVAAGALPALKVLDIHWFSVHPYQLATEKEEEDYFVPLSPKLPPNTSIHLDSCILSGVRLATDDGLLQVLQVLQPSHVSLYETVIPRGAYNAVFAYLADPASPVISYHLDDLNDFRDLNALGNYREGRIHLFGPAKPKYPNWSTPRMLTRDGAEAKTTIGYMEVTTRDVGSGLKLTWYRQKYRHFGPFRAGNLE